jgi:hypothetical protein
VKVRRRELAAAILLFKLYGAGRVNVGLVLDALGGEMGVARRTAINIVKRLRKLGFLTFWKSDSGLYVELKDPCLVLEGYAMSYIESRRGRVLRTGKSGRMRSTRA